MAPARIVVQLLDGETVVHEYRRTTTLHAQGGVQRMVREAMGWMQAYGDQVTNEQWLADVERVSRGRSGAA